MKKPIAIALLLVITALSTIEPALSSSNLDDDVPREKAKKPKLKPPTQLPEVTHRVYLDVSEFSYMKDKSTSVVFIPLCKFYSQRYHLLILVMENRTTRNIKLT